MCACGWFFSGRFALLVVLIALFKIYLAWDNSFSFVQIGHPDTFGPEARARLDTSTHIGDTSILNFVASLVTFAGNDLYF